VRRHAVGDTDGDDADDGGTVRRHTVPANAVDRARIPHPVGDREGDRRCADHGRRQC
jgi:hypothetical protein